MRGIKCEYLSTIIYIHYPHRRENPENKIHEQTGINIKLAFMFTFTLTVQILKHIKKDLDP